MMNTSHIEAVRLSVDRILSTGNSLPADGLKVSNPQNVWHVAILRKSDELFRYVKEKMEEVVQQYEADIRARDRSAGRLINPSFPVQMSGRLIEVAEIIEKTEDYLNTTEKKFNEYCDKAVFGTNTDLEDSARSHLNVSKKLIERTRLYLHTYLWILWAIEGLEQANQFGGVLQNPNQYPDQGGKLFDYIAHPSITVTTFSCTAMIEEVGAAYVNKYTNMSIQSDNTSCSRVLTLLEDEYPDIKSYDVDSIREYAKDTRNDVAHYITKRGSVVTLDEFPEYYSAIWEGINLARQIATFLLTDLLEEYQDLSNPL